MGFSGKWAIIAMMVLMTVLTASCGCQRCQEPIFLYPTPCAPPCWQNIVPGKTQKNDALQVLQASSWVYPDSIKVREYEYDYTHEGPVSEISWDGYSCVRTGGTIEIPGGEIVEEINVRFTSCWGFQRVQGVLVAIDDLIELYGPPLVQVSAVQARGDWRSFGIYLYYPHLGFVVHGWFEGTQGVNSPVPREILVESLQYVPPQRFDEITHLSFCSVPWDGYREAFYYCQCPKDPDPDAAQRFRCEPFWKNE